MPSQTFGYRRAAFQAAQIQPVRIDRRDFLAYSAGQLTWKEKGPLIKEFLGDGPYPVDINSSEFRKSIGIHVGQHVCIVKPRVPLLEQDELYTHAHNSYEFTIPFAEAPLLSQGKRLIRLPKGRMLPCRPGVPHGPGEQLTNPDFLAIQTRPSFLHQISRSMFQKNDFKIANEPFSPPPGLLRAVHHFIDESSIRYPGRELILGTLETQIGIYLLRGASHTPSGRGRREGESRTSIHRAIDMMQAHWAESFSADTLAEAAGMSRYHFFRAFKTCTGKTPYEYLTAIRIEKAMDFLIKSPHCITDIAFKTGFAGSSHFTQVFRRKAGLTPSEFRKRFGRR